MSLKIFDFLITLYLYFYLGLFFTNYSLISNISGPTIGFLFLLLIRYLINKESFLDSHIVGQFRKVINLSDRRILAIAFALLFFTLTALSITRHFSLSSGASDLGIFDQAVWNTARGNVLFSSLKNNINLLGDHFEPILLFIAPLYKIWPNVLVLLILQSLLLASAILPLFLIAKSNIRERFIILAVIVSYVLSKPLRGVALSDFHPEAFIVPLLFWAYYFLIKRKNIWLFLAIFILLLCKEDIAFLISALGIFTYFREKRRRLGLVLFILGIAVWIIETKMIIPYFNPLRKYPYMNRLPFGLTYADNIKAIINNPLLLGKLFIDKQKIEYLFKLFAPLGFLSLLSPAHYILFSVPLLKNLFVNSSFSGFYKISSHYTAGIIPFIYISAIYGVSWLLNKIHHRRKAAFISVLIILSSLLSYSKTGGHKFSRFLTSIKNDKTLQKLSYLKIIPKDASVVTNFNLVPHLSHRKYIFEWNPDANTSQITEYLVIDMTLLEYLPKDIILRIEPYLKDIKRNGYKKIFSSPDENFLIFRNPNIDQTLVERVSLSKN